MSTFRKRLQRVEPYWYPIILFLIGSTAVFLIHLQTGYTPDRVAFSISFLGLDVYWYGILIISGVALGSYVVAHLALERGRRVLLRTVPAAVGKRSLSSLDLPHDVAARLGKRGLDTASDILLYGGFDPDNLGLDEDGRSLVGERMAALRGVSSDWLSDAPWRPWNPDLVWSGVVWALLLAIVGARLYHVLTPSPSMAEVGIFSPLDYFRNPLELINVRAGGLGIYGGIAGGLLGLLLFARRNRLDAIAWADLAAVGLALGQFVGRWGNFVNQELYGRPTDLPWAITIDPIHRLTGYTQFSRFHPAFLYESLWSLMAFLVLLTLARRYRARLLTGDLTAVYLILYAIGRTLLEMVRLDSRTVTLGGLDLNLSIATLVSLVVAVLMALWIVQRHRRRMY